MAFTGIQATVNLYTMQEAELTNRLSDIMQDITAASSQSTDLLKSVGDQKNEIKNEYPDTDSDAYKNAMDEVNYKYELELSRINQWETQLETEKSQLETEIQATSQYKESFMSVLKNNVQKSFKYAQNGQ